MGKRAFLCYEHIPSLIGVKTNAAHFRWGFGQCSEPVAESVFERCRFKVIVEVTSDKHVFDGVAPGDYPLSFRHFMAADNGRSVMFEQSLKRAAALRYVLTVSGNTVKVTVGSTYMRLIKAKMMYVHPIAYILFDVISLLLLQNGLTTLYCSAVKLQNGKTVVCLAPPNTGKSLCALKLRKDYRAEIIAEDMAVTDGTSLWGAPHTGLYRNYHDRSLSDAGREQSLFASDKIDVLAFLQKGKGKSEKKLADAAERLLLLNHYSLGYYYSPCVRVLNYYNRAFSIETAQAEEKRILQKLTDNTEQLWLENADPMQFSEQIRSITE